MHSQNKIKIRIIALICASILSFNIHSSSSSSSSSSSNSAISDGEYFGCRGLYEVYVRVVNRNAYIDVILHEKRPRNHLSDTIHIDINSNNRWHGNVFILFSKKNDFYVEKILMHKKGKFPIKIVADSLSYRRLIKRKNTLLFYEGITEFKKTHDISPKVLEVKIEEYKMFQKIETMNFAEFKTEFEKFKAYLLDSSSSGSNYKWN